MDGITSAALGAALAFSLAVPPGPINAMMAASSPGGALKGTFVGLGAITADTIFLIIILIAHQNIPLYIRPALFILGGFFLLFMSYRVLLASSRGTVSATSGYISGVTVGLSNPYQLGWWLTAGLSMVTILGYASVAGFFGALFLWVFGFPYALHKVSGRYSDSFPRAVRWVSAFTLSVFGLYFIVTGIFGL
jgi:threonine/homoserine/homoserine lactone efflux protein